MPREADNRGNITSETRNGVTVTYEYDELGQLTRVNDPGDPAADSDNGTTWLFTYDRGGNILSKQAYVLSTAAQPTELRQNLIYGYTDANWKDKLTHFCNDELTYDAIGNLTGDIKWTYVWEKGRQLKSMHNAATGVTMEFKYNHEGLRTRKVKKVNGTVTETTDYILKGKHIVAMKKNTDTYYFTYDVSGKPATVTYNGVKYTYIKNLQGDIVAILDASGTLVVEYRYDAWGAPTSILCVNIACDDLAFDNPFRYRGYVWDEETELYYLRSRYYSPEKVRFLNGDSLVGDIGKINNHNMFIYCNNKPTIMADYNGLYPLQFANELLDRWLNGKDDVVIFEEDSRIVKLLKKSKKIQSHIEAAIKDYEDGYPHHLGSDEFTLEDDGAELFLAVQHYRYSLETREEFRTIITSEGIRDQKRYTTVVIIDDVYDFDGFREGFSVPNLLNNFAYFYSCMVGAHDYYWAAIYEHTTEWKNIN